MRIGQLLDGFVHDLDNLAISRYDRFSILSYPKHTLSIAHLKGASGAGLRWVGLAGHL